MRDNARIISVVASMLLLVFSGIWLISSPHILGQDGPDCKKYPEECVTPYTQSQGNTLSQYGDTSSQQNTDTSSQPNEDTSSQQGADQIPIVEVFGAPEVTDTPLPSPTTDLNSRFFTDGCLLKGNLPVEPSLVNPSGSPVIVYAWETGRVVTGQYTDINTDQTWLRINEGWVDLNQLGSQAICGQATLALVPQLQPNGYPTELDIESCGAVLADRFAEAPTGIDSSVIIAYASSDNPCPALVTLFTAYLESAADAFTPPAINSTLFVDCAWDMPGYADLLGRIHRQDPHAAVALNAAFENAGDPCVFAETLNHGDGLPHEYNDDGFLATILPLACNPSFSAERYSQTVEHLNRLGLVQSDLVTLPPTITSCHIVDYLVYVGTATDRHYAQLEDRLLHECNLTAVPTLQYMVTVVTLGIDPQPIFDGLPATNSASEVCTATLNQLLANALARPPLSLPSNLSEPGCSPSLIYSAQTHPMSPQIEAQLPLSCAELASFVHTGYPNIEVEETLPNSLDTIRNETKDKLDTIYIGDIVAAIIRLPNEAELATATFVGQRTGTNQSGDIYILEAGDYRNLTDTDELNEVFPALDPTGSHVVYIQDGEQRQIMLWDLEEERPNPLVTEPVGPNHARIALMPMVFSPDGGRLLFTVEYEVNGNLRRDIFAYLNIFNTDLTNQSPPVVIVENGYAPTFAPYACDGTDGGGIRGCTTQLVTIDEIAYVRGIGANHEVYIRDYAQPFTLETIESECVNTTSGNPCEYSTTQLGLNNCSEALFAPDWQHLYLKCGQDYLVRRTSKGWKFLLDFGDIKLATLSPGPANGFVTYTLAGDGNFRFVQHVDIQTLKQGDTVTLVDANRDEPLLLSIPNWLLSDIRWTTPNEEQ